MEQAFWASVTLVVLGVLIGLFVFMAARDLRRVRDRRRS